MTNDKGLMTNDKGLMTKLCLGCCHDAFDREVELFEELLERS
jgi:hypothetical protein